MQIWSEQYIENIISTIYTLILTKDSTKESKRRALILQIAFFNSPLSVPVQVQIDDI